jgi:hypothetical protein
MRRDGFSDLRRWAALALAMAGGLACVGCHQNFYYYGEPPYGPPVKGASSVQVGSICDVPTQVVDGGTRSSEVSPPSPRVSGTTVSPRVVVSTPDQSPARLSWKRADPDAGPGPTTTVEGNIDPPTVIR